MNGHRTTPPDPERSSLFVDVDDAAVLRAIGEADRAATSMVPFGPMNDRWLRGFAKALASEGLTVGRASASQLHVYGLERITHGRHCTCGSCAKEDWTRREIAWCGMHGEGCPALYDPRGSAGQIVTVREADA